MRSVEYFAESIITDTINMLPQLFPNNPAFTGDSEFSGFNAVRCSRFAEFNFLFDKVKIGKLQCVNDSSAEVLMGYSTNPAISPGNYYLATFSDIFYGIGIDGVTPYFSDNVMGETHSFQ